MALLSNPIDPWFLGQAEAGLDRAGIEETLGAPVNMLTPSTLPPDLKPTSLVAWKASALLSEILKGEPVEGLAPLRPSFYRTPKGIAWAWRAPSAPGGWQFIPVVLYNTQRYKVLTAEESRDIVARRSVEGSMALTQLPGGVAQSSAAPDGSTSEPGWSKAAGIVAPIGLAGLVGYGLYHLLT